MTSIPSPTPCAFTSAVIGGEVRKALGQPQGPLYPEQLERLTALDLQGRSLERIDDLSALTGLGALDLSFNQIADLTPLSGLSRLKMLRLDNSGIVDIAPLKSLSGLEELSLNANPIGDIAPLAELRGLRALSLKSVGLEDIGPIGQLRQLTTLRLDQNRLSDLAPLAGLTALEKLSISGNQIRDLTPLRALTQLTALDVTDNPIDDYSAVAFVPGLITPTASLPTPTPTPELRVSDAPDPTGNGGMAVESLVTDAPESTASGALVQATASVGAEAGGDGWKAIVDPDATAEPASGKESAHLPMMAALPLGVVVLLFLLFAGLLAGSSVARARNARTRRTAIRFDTGDDANPGKAPSRPAGERTLPR